MSNDNQTKRKYREKEGHSPDRRVCADELKRKKKHELVREAIDDFHPDNWRTSLQCEDLPAFSPSISIISDSSLCYDEECQRMNTENNGPVFSKATSVSDTGDLPDWIPTNLPLQITPLNQRCSNYTAIQYQCRAAQPIVDSTTYDDLQRALPNGSLNYFCEIIHPRFKHNFWQDFRSGRSDEQLAYVQEICRQILYRSSYGILFVKNNQFLTLTTDRKRKMRTAVNGYSTLKFDGIWECPWETAVRITKKKLVYKNSQTNEWKPFDMNERANEYDYVTFLECLIAGFSGPICDRYLGLFIIRLNEDIEIQSTKEYSITEWHPLSAKYPMNKFYTILPFISYLQEHPELI